MELEGNSYLQDYACRRCNQPRPAHQNDYIMGYPDFLVIHKTAAGFLQMMEELKVNTVSVYLCTKYFLYRVAVTMKITSMSMLIAYEYCRGIFMWNFYVELL